MAGKPGGITNTMSGLQEKGMRSLNSKKTTKRKMKRQSEGILGMTMTVNVEALKKRRIRNR